MSVKNRTLLIISLLSSLIIVLYLISESFEHNKAHSILKQDLIKTVNNYYNSFPKRIIKMLDSYSDIILNDDKVIDAFIAKDKSVLDKSLIQYKSFLNNQFSSKYIIHFHTSAGESFFRTTGINDGDDYLKNFGYMIKEATNTRKSVYGIEPGKNGIIYRVVKPIFNNGEYIGSFEAGIPLEFFLNRLKVLTNISSCVILYKNDNHNKLFINEDKTGKYFNYFSNDSVFTDLFNKETGFLKEQVNFSSEKKSYLLTNTYPLETFQNIKIGEILFVIDTTKLSNWYSLHFIISVISAFLAMFFCLVVINKGFIDSINELEFSHIKAINEIKELNENLESRIAEQVELYNKSERILHQHKRFADMGQMLSAIAHQWRQPLNNLGLIIQDLSEAYEYEGLTKQSLEIHEQECMNIIQKMSLIIDDFQAYFKTDDEKKHFLLVPEILTAASLSNSQMIAHNIQLNYSCTCENRTFSCSKNLEIPNCEFERAYVYGYQGDFKQVMLNLISNSIYAVEKNIEAGNITEGNINITLNRLPDTAVIYVQDNGGGIPEEILEHIFDPYFTTKDEGEGVGIGLYMCKIIIEKHMDGKIVFENTNDGAVVKISIPITKQYKI